MEAATGLGAIGRVSQWEVPHTSENYVQKEMGYAVARKHAGTPSPTGDHCPGPCRAAHDLGTRAPYAALLAAALALFAAVVERWLFFAEAQHVSMLFYGAKAA